MTEAELLCDRVLLLHRGRFMDSGTVPEVCGRVGAANLADAFFRNLDRQGC